MRRASSSSRCSWLRLQPARASLLDLGAQQRDQVLVVPRLLDEVADAAPHRLHGEIDRSPSGHHDDGERAVERLKPRQQIDALRGPTSCRRCS